MRVLKSMARTTILGCVVSMVPVAAFAGGWSTEGIAGYDLLFAEERFGFEFQSTYGIRNVDFENASTTIDRGDGSGPVSTDLLPFDTDDSADNVAANLWVGAGSVKFGLTDNLDFFARVSEPFEVRELPGLDWNGQFAVGETKADSVAVDGMLSYKHEVSDGRFFRVFGGVRALQLSYGQAANQLVDHPLYGPTPVGTSIDADSELQFGYRIGAAYEMPEIALRALVAYESAIDVELDGVLSANGASQFATYSSATLPQSIEAKIQSGVAPGWLVSLGVKWTDWSVLDSISVDALNPVTGDLLLGDAVVRDLSYSDGWIVEAGVAHQLSDKLVIGGAVTWDKGIGGPYSDYYAFGLGGTYDIGEHVKLSLGGRAIYKTAGEGNYNIVKIDRSTGDYNTVNTDYEYDSSWNFALSTKLRFAF
ncbi:Outer membrane protein transport protein (OMPP1/FadL/TodX) [Pseudovibrio axinellae]|uniref:Outer membrane protein transport protein (OMPP1/FadL/TodX) n=1 Tax=Pseudovibrio axinellae TaxID=989403 RepID=A0A166AUV4_9HYPH|nr:outer membrane protein transport protein [Pseudovibrio axinellae]KZL21580.1 Outer membrane protein transport protein (OMPP1/FadL/TodX) [Pseudovibrio axinellae]SER10380.1 long-chain fatty acid transport protein [Pseudovibrio axinellae]